MYTILHLVDFQIDINNIIQIKIINDIKMMIKMMKNKWKKCKKNFLQNQNSLI